MATRLFHTIVVCGAALALPLGCGADADEGDEKELAERCRLADGSCDEHCIPLADGRCIDPCFVHTETCSVDCIEPDGSCGWPPTK